MRIVAGQAAVREQLADLLTDESRYTEGVPEKVFFPESVYDIRHIVKSAIQENRTITLLGARTGITGGSVPTEGCFAISFSSMKKIRRIIPDTPQSAFLECEPGITLKEIEQFLKNPQPWPGSTPSDLFPGTHNFFYPPDPTEMDAQLGGTVATNASGARSYRYGSTRAHIEGLSLVLASGETAAIRRGERMSENGSIVLKTDQGSEYAIKIPSVTRQHTKNAAGYYIAPNMDLLDLFIGSEGTLAIYSSITVKIQKAPQFLSGLTFFPSREAAFSFAGFLRTESNVCAIEYFDQTALKLLAENRTNLQPALPEFPENSKTALLWEFFEDEKTKFEDRMEQWEEALALTKSSFDSTWAGFDEKGQDQLRIFRHAVPEMVNNAIARNKADYPGIRKVSTDAAVSQEVFQNVFNQQVMIIEKAKIPYVVFGHLGDCHLHFNLIPGNELEMNRALEVYDQLMAHVIENNGTVSAEHGIGKLKKKYLLKMYGEEAIKEMARIRLILDPDMRLSPGNLLD